jgi:hypothetical protein
MKIVEVYKEIQDQQMNIVSRDNRAANFLIESQQKRTGRSISKVWCVEAQVENWRFQTARTKFRSYPVVYKGK